MTVLLGNALKTLTDSKWETKVKLKLKLLKNGMTCRDSVLSNVAIFVVHNIVTFTRLTFVNIFLLVTFQGTALLSFNVITSTTLTIYPSCE